MMKVLLAVDGSEGSDRAVAHAIRFVANSKAPVELHLVTVHLPIVSGDVRMFVGKDAIDAYYRAEGDKALASARRALDAAKVAYVHHIGVGALAETILAYATDRQCEQIIMGTRGLGAISGMLLGSVASKVLSLTSIPVTLVK